MRPARDLELMVVSTIKASAGVCPFDLLAIDDAEVDWFKARLHGRHGVKFIGIVRGTPDDALPLADRIHGRGE